MSSESNNTPLISVVMPVFNAQKFLAQSIESILSQTEKNFEFIIINDGSTDDSENIILSYSDKRIVYIKNEKNLGLSKSFNIGIRAAKGTYIARMDADDISVPERFKKQISYLESHPEIGVIGSSISVIDEKGGKKRTLSRPTNNLFIKWTSLFSTPMYHPTIMARTEIMKAHPYDERLSNSEDYELWSRLLFGSDACFANLNEPLLFYRVFSGSTTQMLNIDKRIASAGNSIRNIENYIHLTQKEEDLLIYIRQEKDLGVFDLYTAWEIYLRAAEAFCAKEHVTFRDSFHVYSTVLSHAQFLIKHKIKKLIRYS
jgi:glycosyltransferase involved in cell wall biosynthesis